VLEPGIGIGGEVSIFSKDMLGTNVFLQLDQETMFADIGMERVERLHTVQLFEAEEALT
jgi:hypothetical protein